MKKMKKLVALIIATAMVLSMMSIAAFAADGDGEPPQTSYTVTIKQNTDDKGTHTYGAYQIFSGKIGSDGSLSNIAWGSGITDAGKTALGDAATYAKGITAANADEKAAELAKYLTAAEKTGSDKIEGLAGGYYLIQDESDPTGTPSAKTKFILKVAGNVEVQAKSSVPSVEKKVQDVNDTTDTTLSDLQDSADYDIGDTIPYTITGTIGSGIGNFKSYSFQFVDKMSAGLTLDENSWDIKVGNKSIKELFTLTGSNGEWTWAAKDIKPEISEGAKVVLTYNATLNENAVIGSVGNPNTVKLKFDNNPNKSGEGKPEGETPEDKNIVFTYKTVFNKVNSNNEPLTGADFKLEKKVGDTWVDVTKLNTGNTNPKKTGDTSGFTFTFSGLDDGDYKLTETVTPDMYNTIDPVEFTITATHEIVADDPKLTELTGADGASFTMTPVVKDGSLTANIVNQKGSELPSTGGIGTTIFYVIGAILVIGAGVVLVTRRRMEA